MLHLQPVDLTLHGAFNGGAAPARSSQAGLVCAGVLLTCVRSSAWQQGWCQGVRRGLSDMVTLAVVACILPRLREGAPQGSSCECMGCYRLCCIGIDVQQHMAQCKMHNHACWLCDLLLQHAVVLARPAMVMLLYVLGLD